MSVNNKTMRSFDKNLDTFLRHFFRTVESNSQSTVHSLVFVKFFVEVSITKLNVDSHVIMFP